MLQIQIQGFEIASLSNLYGNHLEGHMQASYWLEDLLLSIQWIMIMNIANSISQRWERILGDRKGERGSLGSRALTSICVLHFITLCDAKSSTSIISFPSFTTFYLPTEDRFFSDTEKPCLSKSALVIPLGMTTSRYFYTCDYSEQTTFLVLSEN